MGRTSCNAPDMLSRNMVLVGCVVAGCHAPIESAPDAGDANDVGALVDSGMSWPEGQSFPSFAHITTLDVIDMAGRSADVGVMLATLEGQVNKTRPRIYLEYPQAASNAPPGGVNEGPTFWLDKLGASVTTVTDPIALVKKYETAIKGVVIYNDTDASTDLVAPHTINLATTIAGLKGGIVVSPSLYAQLEAAAIDLPKLADFSKTSFKTVDAVYQTALDCCAASLSRRLIVGLDPTRATGPRDLAVAVGAMVMWLPTTDPLFDTFVARLEINSPYVGWYQDEQAGVIATSAHAVPTYAADDFYNMTVLAGSSRTIHVPTPPPAPPLENKIYVAIFMSDGDNLGEDQHTIPNRYRWADPNRGKVPISWTINPGLVDVAPVMLEYYWSTVTPNDVLVSGPSGLGYTYPGRWLASSFDEYAERTAKYMAAAGLRVITVWNDSAFSIAKLTPNNATAYTTHLPHLLGLTIQDSTQTLQVLDGKLPLAPLTRSSTAQYADTEADLESGIEAAAAGWDGTSPRFVAVQGNMNKTTAITPTAFLKVQQDIEQSRPGDYVFVRADHLFQLIRKSKRLAVDP
jgi:hypothetical protein